jgi:hypothetical protein
MTYKRPEDLHGGTQKVILGTYKVYITVNCDEDGPVEVRCSIGKGGSDLQSTTSAICQLVSQTLQASTDRDKVINGLKGLVMTLRGIEGKSFGHNRGVAIKSIPDAIGWALQGYPDRDGNKIELVRAKL